MKYLSAIPHTARRVALAQSNGAAGTIYYPLNFTNVSTHACYLCWLRARPGTRYCSTATPR